MVGTDRHVFVGVAVVAAAAIGVDGVVVDAAVLLACCVCFWLCVGWGSWCVEWLLRCGFWYVWHGVGCLELVHFGALLVSGVLVPLWPMVVNVEPLPVEHILVHVGPVPL